MDVAIQWILFIGLSGVGVIAAGAMLLTMSMVRAGLALMSSFVALAGLFVLLDADLLAAIQIMMNVGGVLVMILFMVMAMMDPGGEMMWDMKRKMRLAGPGAFSMRMPRARPADAQQTPMPDSAGTSTYTCPMHPEVRQQGPGRCPKCGMDLVPVGSADLHAAHVHPDERKAEHGAMSMSPDEHYRMMVDMAMSTAQLPWALAIGAASAALLLWLMWRTPWSLAATGPNADATVAVGELLLSRYMIAFEGAAFLILAGIAAAVILGKREPRARP